MPFINELFGKNVEESLLAADFKVKKNGSETEFIFNPLWYQYCSYAMQNLATLPCIVFEKIVEKGVSIANQPDYRYLEHICTSANLNTSYL